MPSIANDLAAVLSTVRRPGDFFTSGTTELMAPLLEVDGIGPLALPLLPVQAEQLVAVAERALYGRGEDTLVDTAVRRTWQIGADRVRISGKNWARTLESIVARVAEGLGVDEPVAAALYKLLVYDEGSSFVSHRDTEKAPGMFATLVIVLPSISGGGDLVVRHKGREARLALRCPDPSEAVFAAFYADCIHEVLPVTEGCRLTLVYNLLRPGRGQRPEPPDYESEKSRVAALLRAWGKGKKSSGDDPPKKLVYPLEHAYTPAEFGFATLKGADAAVATVLIAAARQSDSELYLAFLPSRRAGSPNTPAMERSAAAGRNPSWKRARSTTAMCAFPNGGGPTTVRLCRSSCPSKTEKSRRPMPSTSWTPTKNISTRRLAMKGRPSSAPTTERLRALAACAFLCGS